MRLKKSTVAFIMMLLMLPLVALAAQTKPDESPACPALVQQALTAVGTACDALDRNSACYGYDRVAAVFAREVQEEEFSQPSDRTSLVDVRAIQTAPLNTETGEWGVAVMNVLANVPNSIPGQGVVFVLLGNVTLGNGVEPADAVQPASPPLTVYTTTSARIRSGAGLNFNTVGGAPFNTPLEADARSADSGWVRIVYGDAPAWISTIVVRSDGDINSLPVIDENSRTPMQAFYFSTGLGTPECSEAPPSTLLVQGPDRLSVELTMNGVDVTIGSTIGLRTMDNNRAQLFV
ncbi:MAG: hypothetical protein H7175_20620, partial [Burkholderiales bacterium]|nr:hypothetical protein [Anaerolineae bacterium]